jgi:hypothetical protein
MARNDSAAGRLYSSRARFRACSCRAALPSARCFEAALSGLAQAGPGRALSGCIKNPAEMLLQNIRQNASF